MKLLKRSIERCKTRRWKPTQAAGKLHWRTLPMPSPWRPTRSGIAILLLGVLFTSTTLVWLALDRSAPTWDDAWYLTNSLKVYDALSQHGVGEYLGKLNSVLEVKAPLIAALPTPFYLVFGRHWHAAYLVNITSMLALFVAVARIARRWRSPRAAVFAIAVAGTMPLLYGLARWFLVEYAMTALLAAAICVLIESDRLQRDRQVGLFGALCGFGMLLKITFSLLILPPFVYIWIRSGRRSRPLILAGLPCLILALPWYAGHLGATLEYAFKSGFGQSVAVYGTGPVLSTRAIATYFSHVAENGVSWYFACLAVALCLYAAFLWRSRGEYSAIAASDFGLLLAWLSPFAVFVFAVNKDIRFVAPLLPVAALAIACLLDSVLPRTRAATALGCLLFVFPVVQMFAVSFGVPFNAQGTTYARSYHREASTQDGLLRAIAADGHLHPGEKELVLVGVDRAFLNADNVELSAVALQLPFSVETTAHEKDLGILRERLALSSYFVSASGGDAESADFNPFADTLTRSVTTLVDGGDRRFAELPYSGNLPDGGIAHVFRNLKPGQAGVDGTFVRGASHDGEEFVASFGGILALTNISVVMSQGETIVKFRWRCIRPPDRDYWCFLHLIDSKGRMVAQHDHRLLGGEPALQSWRSGDAGEEELHLSLPSGTDPGGMRLRFGLYDVPSGERLHLDAPQGAAATRFTLADDGTALQAPVD